MDWAAAKCGAATNGRAATKGCAAVIDWAAAKWPPGLGAKRAWGAKREPDAAPTRALIRGPLERRPPRLLPLLLLPLPLPRAWRSKAQPIMTSSAADKRGRDVIDERSRCTTSDLPAGTGDRAPTIER
jgi:hypothetical protein